MQSPAQRSESARVAVLARNAKGKTNTAPGRRAADQRFVDQVNAWAVENGEDLPLPPDVLRKRVEAARKLHFARMAYASLKTREAKKRKSAPVTSSRALKEAGDGTAEPRA